MSTNPPPTNPPPPQNPRMFLRFPALNAPRQAQPAQARLALVQQQSTNTVAEKRPSDTMDSESKKIRRAVEDGANLNSNIITVVVGEGNAIESFYVHESVLRSSSAFFEAALSNDWKEKATRTVNVPEHAPEHFRIYAQWLYQSHLFIKKDEDDEKGIDKCTEWGRWDRCFKLGHFFQDYDFLDALVDACIEKMRERGNYYRNLAKTIYSLTQSGSPYRKLAIDNAVSWWKKRSWTAEKLTRHPAEFITDVLAEMGSDWCEGKSKADRVRPIDLGAHETCRYHEHTKSGKECYKLKRKTVFAGSGEVNILNNQRFRELQKDKEEGTLERNQK